MSDFINRVAAAHPGLVEAAGLQTPSARTAGDHPLARMSIIYFALVSEDYNIEEDASNGDAAAQELMDNPRKMLALEGKALKDLSRMFGTRIMNEGHGRDGDLVCKFGVRSWADVKKALSVIEKNHSGGDDQIDTSVPYMAAQDFRFYPNGVNDVFFGEGPGAEGDMEDWLKDHK